jgi:predicted outer membrane repeat protein
MDRTVGSSPCTYPTIGAALAAANPGDRLRLEGGVTFVENIQIDKNLTIVGGYSGCGSGSSSFTTIDGNASGSVITIGNRRTVELTDLIVTNGNSPTGGGGIYFPATNVGGLLTLTRVDIQGNTARSGGGLFTGHDVELTATDVEIFDNTATGDGGGVLMRGGSATFGCSFLSLRCDIRNNSASRGGGFFVFEDLGYSPQLTLEAGTKVHHNQALTGDGQGGGILMSDGIVTISGCADVDSNQAIRGGGVVLFRSYLTLDGLCSEISNNTASDHGGGIYSVESVIYLESEAEIYSNVAGSSGTGDGGGAYLDASGFISNKSSIRENSAQGSGGGLHAINGSDVHMSLGTYPCSSVRCSQLSNNTSGSYGGGIRLEDSLANIGNTFLEGNTAYRGGALSANNAEVTLVDSLLAENDSTTGEAEAVWLFNGTTVYARNTTVAHNGDGGAAVFCFSSTLALNCSIVWGHGTSITGATGVSVQYSDIEGGWGAGTANLDVDPLFVSPGTDDYHLQPTSQLIDWCPAAGANYSDFENQPRDFPFSNPAYPNDVGADEYWPYPPLIFADGFESGDTTAWTATLP